MVTNLTNLTNLHVPTYKALLKFYKNNGYEVPYNLRKQLTRFLGSLKKRKGRNCLYYNPHIFKSKTQELRLLQYQFLTMGSTIPKDMKVVAACGQHCAYPPHLRLYGSFPNPYAGVSRFQFLTEQEKDLIRSVAEIEYTLEELTHIFKVSPLQLFRILEDD